MDNVRKFWLENQKGEIYRFTDETSKTFLQAPQGLGINVNYGGFRLGNAEVINYQQNVLNEITGTLIFHNDTRAKIYQDYFNFMNFIANNSLLKLHYSTPNNFDSYYCYCFVKNVDKGEIDNSYLCLRCPVTFHKQTFWRNDKGTIINVTNVVEGDGKRYDLKREYAYAKSSLTNIVMINRGNAEASLKITITGEVVNPYFKIYDSNGVQYGALKLSGTFDKAVVNSDDLQESIELMQGETTLVAPFSYQDLSVGSPNQIYVTFIKVKSGENVGSFTCDNLFNGSIKLEWSDEYASI